LTFQAFGSSERTSHHREFKLPLVFQHGYRRAVYELLESWLDPSAGALPSTLPGITSESVSVEDSISSSAGGASGRVDWPGNPSPRRIDSGAAAGREEKTAKTNAKNKNPPPPIQVIFVRAVAAWRPPMKESVDEEAPPNDAANPPPFPDWIKIIRQRKTARSEITTIRNGNIFPLDSFT
tara:strand:- start:759 stop:1298 length:540 start_codon:yes stop_codon:yes gene_type:complete